MICFLDMDGVIVDLATALHKRYNLPFSYHDSSYPYESGWWDIWPPKSLGMSPLEAWNDLDEDFWVNVGWTKDGPDILVYLESIFGPENICLLSAPTLSHSVSGKFKWIEKNLPQYLKRFLIGPAKRFCAYEDAVLIDDRDKNVEEFIDAGGQAILVPRPWNSLHHKSHISALEIYFVLRSLIESGAWKI